MSQSASGALGERSSDKESVLSRQLFVTLPVPELAQLTAVGYIVPGLLAYWMDRQGVVVTICTMLIAAVPVRLGLIILHGGRLLEDVPM